MNRVVEHLRCTSCETNPSYALINGEGHLVCHCTHVDGSIDPLPIHGFETKPDEWQFEMTGCRETTQ